MFKQFIKDYLVFNRKDRIGLISLIFLIILAYSLPLLFPKNSDFPLKTEALPLAQADTAGESPLHLSYDLPSSEKPDSKGFKEGALFEFDPNTALAKDWERLGLNARTIKTIINYRNKGGRFYKGEDLLRIWGMPEGFYARVKDFIRIPAGPSYSRSPGKKIEKTERTNTTVEINDADTAALVALPGIGSKLSARIINFRNKLGGFYSVEQVAETYGLPDSTFQKIRPYLKVHPGSVKKININTATKDELKLHPYIKWQIANAIVEYRNQHGLFKTLDELKNLVLIDEPTRIKILPYLNVN